MDQSAGRGRGGGRGRNFGRGRGFFNSNMHDMPFMGDMPPEFPLMMDGPGPRMPFMEPPYDSVMGGGPHMGMMEDGMEGMMGGGPMGLMDMGGVPPDVMEMRNRQQMRRGPPRGGQMPDGPMGSPPRRLGPPGDFEPDRMPNQMGMGMGMAMGMPPFAGARPPPGMPPTGMMGLGFGLEPGMPPAMEAGRKRPADGPLEQPGGWHRPPPAQLDVPAPSRPSGERLQNDYCQHFVDTGQRPQNFLRDSHLTDRYAEYPKLKELIQKKGDLVRKFATPPYYLKADLRKLKLGVETFGTRFDVVLIDPPWEEYQRRAPGMVKDDEVWSWQELVDLEIENIVDTPGFVFLWCGSAEGLEAGRHCFNKWGFRRCEDICWVKTNKEQNSRKYLSAAYQEPDSILVHTKEHCLLGIKGTVRRATDGHLIHANCDTDVVVSEEPALGSTEKPEEMYDIIERFVLGRRRLELFGEDHNIRPGWVTVGKSLTASNFNPGVYANHFRNPDGSFYIQTPGGRPRVGAPNLLPPTDDIETLRPKSPPMNRGGDKGGN